MEIARRVRVRRRIRGDLHELSRSLLTELENFIGKDNDNMHLKLKKGVGRTQQRSSLVQGA